MAVQLELLNEDTLAVTFPYDAEYVRQLKVLARRRWNPARKRWEVHLSHLADVMRIFRLRPDDVDEAILEPYRRKWSGGRARVTIGPLDGKLAGPGLPLAEIDRATSFAVPGAKYSPKFQAGKWDGRKHLFNVRNGTFPSGLWPRVQRILDAHETDYETEFTATPAPAAKLRAGRVRRPLRDYQRAVLKQALEARRGVIQMATGGGKTLLAAHLIRKLNAPAMFFVHTRDLLYQAADVLEAELGLEIGIVGDGQASLRPVTVATVQTALRAWDGQAPRRRGPTHGAVDEESDETASEERPTELDDATRDQVRAHIEGARVVIFDECHHVPADAFYKVAMRTAGANHRYGLSATPWRDDEADLMLEAALGERICGVNSSDLIDRDYLVAPEICMMRVPAPRGLPHRLAYADCYRLAIVENQLRNRMIATQARAWAEEGLSVLVLVAQVAHGRLLAERLPGASFVHGAMESAERREYLERLERKLQPVMIATTLADEGLDVPTLDALILAGGGKSQTRAYQRIGRVLRPAPGKPAALVLDFADGAPFLAEHSKARLALYEAEPRFRIRVEG